MKKKRNLYIIAFLCFVTLVGVTIAYLQSTAVLENIFNAGTYKTITHEEFTSPSNWTPGDETPKTITTKNDGTIPVRVRVKFDEEWTSKNGDPLDLTYNGENAAIINLDNEVDWILKDGYYYYTKELVPGETTSSLIKSVTFNPNVEGDVNCTTENGTVTCESTGNSYDGATYKLKITTETVQAKNYEEIWENVPIMYDYVGDNPCTFEGELVPGAEYVNGQYTYRYRQEKVADWVEISENGWGVKLTDINSTDPVTTPLCSSINNKPITSMQYMFARSQSNSIDLSIFDTSNVTNMRWMFNAILVTSLDLSNFDTSNVTDMRNMFTNCYTSNLDLQSFDTSNVTSMGGMFLNNKATSINLSSFDTSNVTSMTGMFDGSQVTSLDLSNFNTSNVKSMLGMFRKSKVQILDLSSFDTSNVTIMSEMFSNSSATSINLSSFDTSNVTSMSFMFYKSKVDNLNLSNFNTSNVTNMGSMFAESLVTTLDLSSFDTSKVTNMISMFRDSAVTTGYARTQADVDKFNNSSNKPSGLTFVVKNS